MHKTTWPDLCPRSPRFQCWFDDRPLDVLVTRTVDFVVLVADEPGTLRLRVPSEPASAAVHPLRLGIEAGVDGRDIAFEVEPGCNLWIEVEGLRPLYVFASLPSDPPACEGTLHHVHAGEVLEAERLELQSGDTLYLECGAVLRGAVRAHGVRNIRICGPGIIDGCNQHRGGQGHGPVVLYNGCEGVRVEDVTLINSCSWVHVLRNSRKVQLANLHIIGDRNRTANDGIDIVNSSDVEIRGGLIHSNDDCVVIKAFCSGNMEARREKARKQGLPVNRDWQGGSFGNSERIDVSGCALVTTGGSCMEIGHELQCERVGDIAFRDIDVLGCHGHGAPFSINNMDGAVVEHVLYEDIRVEHHYAKLFNLRVSKSRYAYDKEYGRIRDITFRDLSIAESQFNPGYTCSVIGGHDANSRVENVTFERVRVGDSVLGACDDFDCYTKHVSGIVFKPE